MPKLPDVLGAILADIATARQMADEQTARLALRYQADDLLREMSVPRIRLPEVIIDLPILIEGCNRPDDDGARGLDGPDEPGPKERASAERFKALGGGALKRVDEAERSAANGGAQRPAEPPTLSVLVAARDLDGRNAASFTRLRLTLREEGLDLKAEEGDDDEDKPRGAGDGPEGRPLRLRLIPE